MGDSQIQRVKRPLQPESQHKAVSPSALQIGNHKAKGRRGDRMAGDIERILALERQRQVYGAKAQTNRKRPASLPCRV
jgi:hypothetical protein